jgi:phage N-6-adenine-methyltransferase
VRAGKGVARDHRNDRAQQGDVVSEERTRHSPLANTDQAQIALVVPSIAVEIGRLYRRGIEDWLEAGRLLQIQKDALTHGQWLPWLEENRERLGFGVRAAQRLIQIASNTQSTAHLDVWWNDRKSHRTLGTGNYEWYTPGKYIEMARRVLGDIDLDPASCEVAQRTVKARKFYTKQDDGLSKQWHGRVWLNPPYANPLMTQFVDKLLDERNAKRVKSAILLSHNFTDTGWFQKAAMLCQAICFTRGRIYFIDQNEQEQRGSPANGQAFMYFGPDTGTFFDEFSAVGVVVRP